MPAVDYNPGNPPANGTVSSDDGQAAVNDVEFVYFSRRLFVGVGGDVSLVTKRGTTLLYKNVPSGSWIDMRASKVNASGTTATNIIAQY